MKAVEFESTITPGGGIALSPEVVSEIPPGAPLRIVVMWEMADSDLAWRRAGLERFEAAYAPEDSVYERLIDGPANR